MNPGYSVGLVALVERGHIMSTMIYDSWNRWYNFYAPSMFKSSGRNVSGSRNIHPGDVVVVTESDPLRQGCFIANAKNVYPSKNCIVRRVDMVCQSFKVGDEIHKYKVYPEVVVTRGVKNLGLLVGVDEL